MTALAIAGVSKSYGAARAISDIDIEVGDGEIVALVGPSGCGKSTLLRIVAGLVAADAGTVRIGDVVVDDGRRLVDPELRGVGLVFQEHALFPHLTVADNLTFGLRGLPRSERPRRADHWLDVIGLAGHGARYPHELSGGERQRVALARALAPQPRLMLLDEPFASLDPNLRADLREEIVGLLRATRTPAVFVTHDQVEALAVGDRVAVMRAGRVEQFDDPETVFHRPTSRFVASFIGEAAFVAVEGEGMTELGPIVVDGPVAAGSVVVVRPDELLLVSGGVEAEVLASEFRGPSRSYHLRLPSGAELHASQPHGVKLVPGDRVGVSLGPGPHAVLPPE
jgi:iron(III) transport system ATP-binding protein